MAGKSGAVKKDRQADKAAKKPLKGAAPAKHPAVPKHGKPNDKLTADEKKHREGKFKKAGDKDGLKKEMKAIAKASDRKPRNKGRK